MFEAWAAAAIEGSGADLAFRWVAMFLLGVIDMFVAARAIVIASAMIGATSPTWSQRLTALAWQLVTPLLLRSGLYQSGIQNRSGMRPIIVRVTSEPFGERVRLWCPAGVSSEDFMFAKGVLCTACLASDVQIRRDEHHSQIVIVDVVRRRDQAGASRGNPSAHG